MDQSVPSTPTPPPVQPVPQPPAKGTVGPLIGAAIIVGLLIMGGLYYWGAALNEREENSLSEEETSNLPDAMTQELSTQSSSDEVGDIEADLEATSFTDIDAELDDIESEI